MYKINKDNVDKFFDYNMHFESRIIHIGTPDVDSEDGGHQISFHTASEVIKSIMMLEGASTAPISVNLMSYGGNFDAALAIYDVLTACRCEIIVRGIGVIMSGGAIIMQAASKGNRLLYPNAQVMLHDGEDGYQGHPRDFERWAEHGKKMRTVVYNLFADRCGTDELKNYKADYWRKKMDRDWILTAEEAVDLNIADEICTKNFNK